MRFIGIALLVLATPALADDVGHWQLVPKPTDGYVAFRLNTATGAIDRCVLSSAGAEHSSCHRNFDATLPDGREPGRFALTFYKGDRAELFYRIDTVTGRVESCADTSAGCGEAFKAAE